MEPYEQRTGKLELMMGALKKKYDMQLSVAQRKYGVNFYTVAFMQGSVYAETHPYWFNPEECLPEEDEPVLALDKHGLVHVARYLADSEEWVGGRNDDTAFCGIVRWIPIPILPELEDQDGKED
jgi:hypothetical protein